MMQNFLPSFKGQRSRKLKSENKKFLKEEFLANHSLDIKNLSLLHAKPSIYIEIGSGNGTIASKFAKDNPDILYISCEVFMNGIIQGCQKALEDNLSNIYFFTKDARELLAALPRQCLDAVFLFFPDPWPKKRHHKRRIFNIEFLSLANFALKEKGKVLLSTDHEGYKSHIKEMLALQSEFNFMETAPPNFWIDTKYYKKAIKAGREITFFTLEKK